MSDKILMVLLEGLTSELGNCISEMIALMPEDAERETIGEFATEFSSMYQIFSFARENRQVGEWSPGNRFAALVPAFDLLDEWEFRFSRLADPLDE